MIHRCFLAGPRTACRIPAALLLALSMTVAGCESACDTPIEPTGDVSFSSTDVRLGTGAAAAIGQTLRIHGQGWLYSTTVLDRKGTQFATTIGGPPADVLLVQGQVLDGWIRGLPGMRVGGLRRLILPPDLAYGESGNGVVPARSTVIFDIELVEIREPVDTPPAAGS